MGRPRDNQLKVKKRYDVERRLMASRSYLKGRRQPKTPKDVEDWDWLELLQAPSRPAFRHGPVERITLRPSANNAVRYTSWHEAAQDLLCFRGFWLKKVIDSGAMEIILPTW